MGGREGPQKVLRNFAGHPPEYGYAAYDQVGGQKIVATRVLGACPRRQVLPGVELNPKDPDAIRHCRADGELFYQCCPGTQNKDYANKLVSFELGNPKPLLEQIKSQIESTLGWTAQRAFWPRLVIIHAAWDTAEPFPETLRAGVE